MRDSIDLCVKKELISKNGIHFKVKYRLRKVTKLSFLQKSMESIGEQNVSDESSKRPMRSSGQIVDSRRSRSAFSSQASSSGAAGSQRRQRRRGRSSQQSRSRSGQAPRQRRRRGRQSRRRRRQQSEQEEGQQWDWHPFEEIRLLSFDFFFTQIKQNFKQISLLFEFNL